MAVIGKIRSKSTLLIIIIGVALAAFVLGDFIKNPQGRGRDFEDLVVVNGEPISINDLNKDVDERIAIEEFNNPDRPVNQAQAFNYRNSFLDQMIKEQVLLEQYNELGLAIEKREAGLPQTISEGEYNYIIFGNDPHTAIKQNFTDPKTKQFIEGGVAQFINNFKQMLQSEKADERQQGQMFRAQWKNLEKYVMEDRMFNKYQNLIKKGFYTPTPFAKLDYINKNKVAKINLVALRYITIPEDSVILTETDYEEYYNKHVNALEQQNTRNLEYIVYEVVPSEEDIKATQEKVEKLHQELINTPLEDVETLVNRQIGNRYDSTWRQQGMFPPSIDTVVFDVEIGTTLSPVFEGNTYLISRLVDIAYRPDSVKASHILFTYRGAMNAADTIAFDREGARDKKDSIFQIIKSDPGRFEEFARTVSDGPSKIKDGDVGWFADSDPNWAPEFKEYCVTGEVGEIDTVETVFGFHIIKITGKKDPVKKVRVAMIQVLQEPSEETDNMYYQQASAFIAENRTIDMFRTNGNELNIRQSGDLYPATNAIGVLENPRRLVQWAFKPEREEGEVTEEVMQFGNKYVVAALSEIKHEGTPSLEEAYDFIDPLVKNDKKADMAVQRLAAKYEKTKDLQQLALQMGVPVDSMDYITFYTTLRGYGQEPKVIGTVFSMNNGEIRGPIKGEQSAYMVKVNEFVEAPEVEDFTPSKNQVNIQFGAKIHNEIYTILKKKAEISDNRALYF
jgi:peptidyl-prolyl cis-trans isomerase D